MKASMTIIITRPHMALLAILLCQHLAAADRPSRPTRAPLKYVDPFIAARATDTNGFPGTELPFRTVAVSPDCINATTGIADSNSGYREGRMRGFSHLHVSGCIGPSTFGVETCTRPMDPELTHKAFEEIANGNLIFDNSVEEVAKAWARAQR